MAGTVDTSGSVDTDSRIRLSVGTRIIMPPEDQDHGGRFYACRDPEANLWNFGSYDPWKSE